ERGELVDRGIDQALVKRTPEQMGGDPDHRPDDDGAIDLIDIVLGGDGGIEAGDTGGNLVGQVAALVVGQPGEEETEGRGGDRAWGEDKVHGSSFFGSTGPGACVCGGHHRIEEVLESISDADIAADDGQDGEYDQRREHHPRRFVHGTVAVVSVRIVSVVGG